MRMSSIGSSICTLSALLVVLFGVVMGGAVLLEEVYHWRQILSIYSLNPLPVHTLCFLLIVEDVISLPPALATDHYGHVLHTVMDSPSGIVRQTKCYLP